MVRAASRISPHRFHFTLAMILAVVFTVALWWFLSQRGVWQTWVGCWLFGINVVSFGYYGYDKSRASAGGSRVPEMVLHALTAVGGSLGAYLGMRLFRHKTIKGPFRILFWCIVVLQVALLALVVKMIWWE